MITETANRLVGQTDAQEISEELRRFALSILAAYRKSQMSWKPVTPQSCPKADKPRLTRQCRIILNHMQQHGSITNVESFETYRVMRIGSRIHDIRRCGFDVITEDCGDGVHRYRLPTPPAGTTRHLEV